jgi:hypothetical protein
MTAYFFVVFLRYPIGDNVFPPIARASALDLSVLDYFFSTGASKVMRSHISGGGEISLHRLLRTQGEAAWLKGNPYLVLLKHYLEFFFPVSKGLALDSDVEGRNRSRFEQSEAALFLRLAVDFWIDTAPIVRQHFEKVPEYLSAMRRRSLYSSSSPSETHRSSSAHKLPSLPPGGGSLTSSASHNPPAQSGNQLSHYDWADDRFFDMSLIEPAPIPIVPSCTSVLLLESCNQSGGYHNGSTLQCIYLLISQITSNISPNDPLPVQMEILQQPLFDMLRYLLSRCSTV